MTRLTLPAVVALLLKTPRPVEIDDIAKKHGLDPQEVAMVLFAQGQQVVYDAARGKYILL